MDQPKARYSHIGICVSDLDLASNFYRDALGFVDGSELTIENACHDLLGVEGDLRLESRFLRLGDLVIELLHWARPGHFDDQRLKPLNSTGLTHMSMNVSDLDAILTDVDRLGGTVLHHTRSPFQLGSNPGEIVFVQDPDGTRIELMAFAEDVRNA